MPIFNLICDKCEYEENDVFVEWDKDNDTYIRPICQKCGGIMSKNYSNLNYGTKIKGWSPDKESWAKKEAQKTQELMAEGFTSKQELDTAKAMYQEKYGDITNRNYGDTKEEKENNMKKHAKEQVDKISKDAKKRMGL